jgi:hypothetical protein
MFYRVYILGLILLCFASVCQAQTNDTLTYKHIAAGPEYKKSNFHQKLWGKNRRIEWTTPVWAPLIKLDTAFGGIYPYQQGGGNETKSLRLKTGSGKEYALRSINKSRDDVVPKEFKGTFIESIIKDGVSQSHPYGAFAVVEMQRSAGIFHTNPRLVYVPAQLALDSFNKKFGDDLYLLEQRPDGDWSDADNLGNFKKYNSTLKVTEKILEDNRNKADQHLFVRGRLFDMFINDWDRHEDNWRWGVTEKNKDEFYTPVPRDRDQAFYTYNGVLIKLVISNSGLGYMQNFDTKIKDVRLLNWEERNFDRFFMNSLTLKDWLDAAEDLKLKITDEAIERSVRGLPPEIFAVSGQELIDKLKIRKNDLHIYAKDYYNFLAAEVDVTGSKERERFEINSEDPNKTTVQVFHINKNGRKDDDALYTRTFGPETKEIRLYGIEGEDVFEVKNASAEHVIRIVGGPQKDSILQSGNGKVRVYDDKNNYFNVGSAGLRLSSDSSVHAYNYQSYNYSSQSVKPFIFFNVDDLWYVGLNYNFLRHKWRRAPYARKGTIGVNYYGARRAISVAGSIQYPNVIGKWGLGLAAEYDAVNWTNFFGLGNETKWTDKRFSFNRIRSKDWNVSAGLSKRSANSTTGFSLFFHRDKVLNDTNKYVSKVFTNDNAFRSYHYAGAQLQYSFVSVNDSIIPTKGFTFTGKAALIRNITEADVFQNYSGRLQFYIPLGNKFSVAIRGGGQIITNSDTSFNNAQVTQFAVIGGATNLRGYRLERFWGKSAFYNNNELRFITNIRSYLLNAKAGVFAFYDNGRVWMPGEKSNTLHTSYGAGLLLAPFNKLTIQLTYGISNEAKLWQFGINTLL